MTGQETSYIAGALAVVVSALVSHLTTRFSTREAARIKQQEAVAGSAQSFAGEAFKSYGDMIAHYRTENTEKQAIIERQSARIEQMTTYWEARERQCIEKNAAISEARDKMRRCLERAVDFIIRQHRELVQHDPKCEPPPAFLRDLLGDPPPSSILPPTPPV